MSVGLIVDNFCGGGGASTGIEMALGRSPDIAINHDPEAIAMHKINHPNTRHYCKSIYQVDPDDIIREYKNHIDFAWFSPDCTHHSKARGGRPKEKHIRDLAWVIVHWAERAVYKGQRIKRIAVENVNEFKDWCELDAEGKPIPEQKGWEFQRWLKAMRKFNYKHEYRELTACDYGAGTSRTRLVIIFTCDGGDIVWPEITHGPGRLPYRTAAECINWSIPCRSIFLTKEEGKAVRAKRPLAEPTMRRVAHGMKRFVLDAKKPFIVNLTHQGGERVEDIDEPFRTITGAKRGEKSLVTPYITKFRTGSTGSAIDEPLHTITAGGKSKRPAGGAHAMGLVTLVLAEQTAAAAFLSQHNGQSIGQNIDTPQNTIVGKAKHSLVTAFIAQHNNPGGGGVNPGRSIEDPMSTITASGSQQGLVTGHIVKLKGTCKDGHPVTEPLATIQAGGQHFGAVTGNLIKYYGTDGAQDMEEPLHTITSKDRFGFVQGQLAPTLTETQIIRARQVADLLRRYGLWDDREFVTLEFGGTTWIIADIGLRMLVERELFNAQGFPSDYVIHPIIDGKRLSKTAAIRMCGNSVSPDMARAVAAVNYPYPELREITA